MGKKIKSELSFIPSHIRNISIISHVDHGKTTLSDHLIASGGILPAHLAGSLRALDFLPEEQRRGITIESSIATFNLNIENEIFQVNLIDTPGHVDFSGKVAESLRLVDGGLIIVDAVEGIMAQTRTVLRQAINENLILVLFINKIDRLITEVQLKSMEIQQRIERIIGEVKSICLKYGMNKKFLPSFKNNSVILGSALDGWAIDYNYVKSGRKLDEIIRRYQEFGYLEIPPSAHLAKTLIDTIFNILPDPQAGQKNKFPQLFSSKAPDKFLKDIFACDDQKQSIVLIGRLLKFKNTQTNGYLIRVLSGKIQRGSKLKSHVTSEIIKISRLIQLSGRTSKSVEQLRAGQIGGMGTNSALPAGDLLTNQNIEKIELNQISYVQNPVVAISIEPVRIKDIGKLENLVESIVNRTPGLKFEANQDTGELIALGVGTLQLDILVSELLEYELEIEVSDPKILKFEIPQGQSRIVFDIHPGLEAIAAKTSLIDTIDSHNLIIADTHQNRLIFSTNPQRGAREGIIEVFRQYMKISPSHGIRIKEFTLKIEKFPEEEKYHTYENGIVLGSALIKKGLELTDARVHEPYYTLEINLPEEYLGATIHELQRAGSTIDQIDNRGDDCILNATIPVRTGIKLADKLRQITDGNVFWSFPSTIFLPSFQK